MIVSTSMLVCLGRVLSIRRVLFIRRPRSETQFDCFGNRNAGEESLNVKTHKHFIFFQDCPLHILDKRLGNLMVCFDYATSGHRIDDSWRASSYVAVPHVAMTALSGSPSLCNLLWP